jgi:hypothetical protein
LEASLVLSALLLGLAGAPHCAAMCGPACGAVVGACSRGGGVSAASWAFHAGRMLAYTASGALAAAGVGVLASTSAAWPVLRPLWTVLHLAAIVLGLWLAWTGRQPAWMSRIGRARTAVALQPAGHAGWKPLRGPVSGAAAATGSGLAWVLWPCGLLQSALVVAGLANTPQGGAMAMFAFAATSALGLQWAPWAWRRWATRGADGRPSRVMAWAVRGAGLMLAIGSAWALGHDVWGRVWDYCFG